MSLLDKVFGNKEGKPIVEDTEESLELEKEAADKRIKGRIIKVDSRGFGFIVSNELPFERIFFHWTSLRSDTLKFPELRRNMDVEFTAKLQEPKDRGYKAIRIVVLDE